jgi:hypothetical protein
MRTRWVRPSQLFQGRKFRARLRPLAVVRVQQRRLQTEPRNHDGIATDSHRPPEFPCGPAGVEYGADAPEYLFRRSRPSHNDHRHRPVACHVDQPAPFGRTRRRGDNPRAPNLFGFDWRVSCVHVPECSAGCHRENEPAARDRLVPSTGSLRPPLTPTHTRAGSIPSARPTGEAHFRSVSRAARGKATHGS